jgi:Na+-transporting methylmalonyl-CoA/oxaloacetate decarboxylase gamma subunit
MIRIKNNSKLDFTLTGIGIGIIALMLVALILYMRGVLT